MSLNSPSSSPCSPSSPCPPSSPIKSIKYSPRSQIVLLKCMKASNGIPSSVPFLNENKNIKEKKVSFILFSLYFFNLNKIDRKKIIKNMKKFY